ncbi:MAG: TlpA family protein disulfide reductase [Chitinophagales bacterium]|nr:TlpA family protein disulfide reductase [Chitinophagales bacterium]
MLKKIFSIVILFLCLVAIQPALSQEKRLPEIVLSDIDGNKVDVSQLSKDGKIIILSFWATWCVPCKKELTNIMDLYEDWQKDYNVELIAISIDDTRNITKVKPTVEGSGWPYRVLVDPNQDLKRALSFQNVPYTVVTDKAGNIAYIHNGYVEGDEFELEERLKALSAQ